MRSMLSTVLRARFSKTAGSGPGHREAGGGVRDLGAGAIVGRVDADDVAKSTAEGAEAPEPDVEADVGDAPRGLAQQEHGPLDPPALQVSVRSLAKGRAESPDEVRLGDARHASQGRDVERLRVGSVDRIAGAEHAAVEFLDGTGHRPILPALTAPKVESKIAASVTRPGRGQKMRARSIAAAAALAASLMGF